MDNTNLFTVIGNKMILGIGREYTKGEKIIIRRIGLLLGFKIPPSCHAGIYIRKEK